MKTILIFCLSFVVSCSSDEKAELNTGENNSIKQTNQTARWQLYKKPDCFSVSHPEGWRVQFDSNSGKITLKGRAGENIVIWPFYVQRPLPQSGAATILKGLAQKLGPNQRWGRPQALTRTVLRTDGRGRKQISVASLVWTSGAQGSAGYFYLVSAPENRYQQKEEMFTKILKSFHAYGPSGKMRATASQPKMRYIHWQDPKEYAFDLEVPQGWQVQGGIFRFAAVDVRTAVHVTSPDGQIYIFIGDANVPPFVLPSQMLQMSGLTEGSWYNPYGTRMLVKRYVPGMYFAKEYVMNTFRRQVSGLSFTRTRNRPDASQAINAIYQQHGSPYFQQRLDTGEVEFVCYKNQQTLLGYTFAGTSLLQSASLGADAGNWTLQYLYGFIAPKDGVPQAQIILAHMLSSTRMNPQWVRAQQNVTGNVSNIVSQTNNYLSRLITDRFEYAQRTGSETNRRFSNYLRGVVDVVDPTTQETYKVQSGSNYYWIDALGNITGTNLSNNPDFLKFREMVQLP
ncbi:MAG: hypothetical protein ACE5HI_11520 [bacterium]